MIEVEKVIAFSTNQTWASCTEGKVLPKHHCHGFTIITGSINGPPGDLSSLLFPTLGWYIMMRIMNLIGPPPTLTFTASFVALLAVVRHSIMQLLTVHTVKKSHRNLVESTCLFSLT